MHAVRILPPSKPADAAGVVHEPAGGDARIVCLVPSITELVCDLGLADQLVGRTGFCIHPWETVRTIPKLGGTKDVKLDRIRAARADARDPQHRREPSRDADALAEFVPHIVVTHPARPARQPRPLPAARRDLRPRGARPSGCAPSSSSALDELRARPWPPRDVLYLIWREPWMAVAPDTYISQTLALVNWHTQPLGAADRYPEVDLSAFASKVDRVLLSSEPYHFRERHIAEVAAAVPGAEVSLIDGEMTSWYGSRAILGLRYLADYATTMVAG